MSADPVFDLQAAIVPALVADASLAALIAGRVYDDVPPTREFPYISIGPVQAIQQDTDDCICAYEVSLQMDVWARGSAINGGGYERARPQMERVAGTLRQVLHGADLTLDNHRLVQIRHTDTLYLRDPDGQTAHGAVTFRALVDRL